MDDKILDLMNKKDTSRKKYRNWKKIVTSLAAVVVFCTTYMLIVPAITMEKDTICGKEEHLHDENCYVREITQQELQLDCTYESLDVHIHSGECEDEEGNIICGLADYIVHEHKDMCFDAEQKLVCELPEVKAHAHTDECYKASAEEVSAEPVLVCNKADVAIHEHTDSCIKSTEVTVEAAEQLVCTKEEHTHDETCLPKETEDPVVENNDAASSEEDPASVGYVNAWAETEDQTAAPVMRSFAMRNSNSVSTYATARSGPLDMTEWINDVTMYKHEDGKVTEIENGTVVYEGDLIQFKLDYTIKGQQLKNNVDGLISNTVIYKIPDTFKTINSNSGNIYNSDDEIVGTYVIDSESNTIILTYDDKYVNDNGDGKQIHGYISFFSIVDKVNEDTNEEQNHHFNSKTEVTLNVQESQEIKGDLSVEKAKTNVDGNVIKYMITVTSAEGTKGSVTLTDVMCEDLTYIKGTLSVTKNGSSVNYTVNESNNSLVITLPEMEAKDRYIITYSAEADVKLQNAKMEVSNTVTVESKDSQNNPLKDSTTVTHNFDILDKKGEPGANGTIDWTITINKARLDISGWKLTDVLNGVEFKGPVNIYNSSNVLIKQNVTLPYTFPSGSTDMYYIRYTTEHSLMEGMDVTNEARFEKNGITVTEQAGSGIGTPIDKKGQITTKEALKDEDGTYWVPITWTVTIDTSAGPIPAGNSLVDNLNPSDASTQRGYMTYDQVISAYYSINETLQKELNTSENVLSLSNSKVTVYPSGKSYTITQLLNNNDNSQSYKFGTFEFVLAKDIPQGKNISFSYTSTGIFYSNTVINSTYANSFSISNSYEVVARVTFSVGNIQAFKRAYKYYDPNGVDGNWYWDYIAAENAEFTFEQLKDKYLAWGIEVDIPKGYSGSGDVILYEDLPEGVTVRGIETKEISGDSAFLGDIELGKEYELRSGRSGNYTIKVTDEGDLEITIPEEAIEYRCNQFQYNTTWNEWWTFFYIFVQINDDIDWPHINENSMISKKAFENNFTLVNSNGDTIAFGKQTQTIKRDDSEGHVIKGYSTDQNYVTYQVLLNPEGRDFDPNSSTLDVNDTLVYTSTEEKKLDLELVATSVILKEYLGKDSDGKVVTGDSVDFSYIYKEEAVTDVNKVTTKTHTIDLVVPDGKPLVLEYRYRADGTKEQHSLVNTCTIESVGQGQIDDDSGFEMQVTQSMAGADTAGVTIYKVDASNYGVHLPNAKFALYIWNDDKNQYIQVTGSDGNKDFVTGDNGKIVLDSSTLGEDYFAYNTAYKLEEVASPDGYYLLDEEYYFYIENENLVDYPPCMPKDFQGKALTDTDNVFMPNESSYTKLAIRKKWKDHEGKEITIKADEVSEVSFEVWRKTEGVENSDVYCDTYTVTPDENGFWETVITNLPKGERGANGTKGASYIYYIKEVSVPGFKVIEYEYDDGDETTMDDAIGIQTGTIIMTNQELDGYVLPETGGIGTTLYTVGGLLLMMTALSLLSYKNKKHRKEDFTSS